jgi:hypothetical protein
MSSEITDDLRSLSRWRRYGCFLAALATIASGPVVSRPPDPQRVARTRAVHALQRLPSVAGIFFLDDVGSLCFVCWATDVSFLVAEFRRTWAILYIRLSGSVRNVSVDVRVLHRHAPGSVPTVLLPAAPVLARLRVSNSGPTHASRRARHAVERAAAGAAGRNAPSCRGAWPTRYDRYDLHAFGSTLVAG